MRGLMQAYYDSIHWAWTPYIALALTLGALVVCVRDAMPDPLQAVLAAIWPQGSPQVKLAAIKRQAHYVAGIVLCLWVLATLLCWAASLALLVAGPLLGFAFAILVGVVFLLSAIMASGGWLGALIGWALAPRQGKR